MKLNYNRKMEENLGRDRENSMRIVSKKNWIWKKNTKPP